MKRKLKKMSTVNRLLVVCTVTAGIIGLYFGKRVSAQLDQSIVVAPVMDVGPHLDEYPFEVKKGNTVGKILRENGVSDEEIHLIAQAAKPVYDLKKVKPKTKFRINYSPQQLNQVESITFKMGPAEVIEVSKVSGQWFATQINEPIETKVVYYSGVVKNTLWQSAVDAGMDPNITADMADVFAWQIDFAREVRVGDDYRVAVEQKLVRGQHIGWGKIVAAEYYSTKEDEILQAIWFDSSAHGPGYYKPNGESLRRMFLKSPVRYSRITSGFTNRRFHPITKEYKPHLGIDYAADVGTPVRAIGDGIIDFADWKGGGGKEVDVRHNSVWTSKNLHLSNFAKGIRKGVRVKQGQVIGYVGQTGLATGPHLHFAIYKNGQYVNPSGKTFPSADPVPASELAAFRDQAGKAIGILAAAGPRRIPAGTESAQAEQIPTAGLASYSQGPVSVKE